MNPTSQQIVNISALVSSKTNPRRNFNKARMIDLISSIREHGILQSLLIRPVDAGKLASKKYEIVAGERRYRAAKEVGLEEIPVLIRMMTDTTVMELQLIENVERDDLHPLEEARGFQQLIAKGKGYDAAKVAARIGRSVKYVYDRVKLMKLTMPIQAMFLKGRIEAGHAILLARLHVKDQARASDRVSGGLFESENTLFDPYEKDGDRSNYKARSVRELQGWIDEHVKFQAKRDADPMLFPEAAKVVASTDKFIPITHDYHIKPDARDGKRVLTHRSWTRADGQYKSKKCDESVMGMIVVGVGRGDAFRVCIAKKKCRVHYAKEMREAKARAAGKPARARQQTHSEKEHENYERMRELKIKEQERWNKAAPKIREAVAMKVRKASGRAGGLLADILVKHLRGYGDNKLPTEIPRGKTAEDLVRHAVFIILAGEINDPWNAVDHFPKRARAFGIDVKKIVNEVAPKEKVQTSAKKKKKS